LPDQFCVHSQRKMWITSVPPRLSDNTNIAGQKLADTECRCWTHFMYNSYQKKKYTQVLNIGPNQLDVFSINSDLFLVYRPYFRYLIKRPPVPVGLQPFVCWDREFEFHRRHGCLSVVSVVCYQVEVSATGWSLIQRSPTDCGG